MKLRKQNKDILLDSAIIILATLILIVCYFRFIRREKNSFECRSFEEIKIIDRKGNEKRIIELLNPNGETYVLFLEINSCPSCIQKGFNELKSLMDERKAAFAVVIHDWFEEWSSWVAGYESFPIYLMRRETYHNYIFSPYMPVLVKFNKNKVAKYRYVY